MANSFKLAIASPSPAFSSSPCIICLRYQPKDKISIADNSTFNNGRSVDRTLVWPFIRNCGSIILRNIARINKGYVLCEESVNKEKCDKQQVKYQIISRPN